MRHALQNWTISKKGRGKLNGCPTTRYFSEELLEQGHRRPSLVSLPLPKFILAGRRWVNAVWLWRIVLATERAGVCLWIGELANTLKTISWGQRSASAHRRTDWPCGLECCAEVTRDSAWLSRTVFPLRGRFYSYGLSRPPDKPHTASHHCRLLGPHASPFNVDCLSHNEALPASTPHRPA